MDHASIIGTGPLSVPVLAGSAAYALGEARRWPVGLARKPKQAKAFYATIAVAMLGGAALNFAPINPIKALFWSVPVEVNIGERLPVCVADLRPHKSQRAPAIATRSRSPASS
jgi:hypothetical protein